MTEILLLDGATGTELDRRGVDVALPLWSAIAIEDAPEVLRQIHIEYLEAGAAAIVTNTFRTHRRSLDKADRGEDAEMLTRRAVEIARAARDAVNTDALVLGSVSPLEDCYHPEWSPSVEVCHREHAEIMSWLLDAGVDMLAIETMSTRHEAIAAAETARRLAPGKWMISFCTKTTGPPGVMQHGAPLIDVLPVLQDAYAVGVNCVAAPAIAPQVALLRRLLPAAVRVAAYGNIGHADAAGDWLDSDAIAPDRYAEYVETWIEQGAAIVGGCCGTTPDTIRAVATRLASRTP